MFFYQIYFGKNRNNFLSKYSTLSQQKVKSKLKLENFFFVKKIKNLLHADVRKIETRKLLRLNNFKNFPFKQL